jgi:16S rRNA (uracil1498-N3)-methyltransferase
VSVNLLVTPAELDSSELVVDGEAYRHLFRAARVATGDAVRVVDGRGRARDGEVAAVDRRRAVVTLGAAAPSREPRLRLELLSAVPRPSRASWLIEKGTELGVRAFRFLDCERSARPLDSAALDRLRRIARAAVEQCGRSWVPELTASHRLEEALGSGDFDASVVLDPDAAGGAAGSAGEPARDRIASLAVVVGPEGGFTPAELDQARRAGARPLRLVPSVLRIETAALAAAAWALIQWESDPARPGRTSL